VSTADKFEAWAIVDLFGHQHIAGKLTEQAIGGCHFIRVDVPAFEDSPAFTKLYTQGAIYGVTFVGEQIARAAARSYRVAPVSVYELRDLMQTQGKLIASPAPVHVDDDDDQPF
jgi:hypothetical protein